MEHSSWMFPVSRRRVFVLVIFHRHGLGPVVVFDEIKRKSQASQLQFGGGAVQVRCGAVEVTLTTFDAQPLPSFSS